MEEEKKEGVKTAAACLCPKIERIYFFNYSYKHQIWLKFSDIRGVYIINTSKDCAVDNNDECHVIFWTATMTRLNEQLKTEEVNLWNGS